MTRLRMRVAKIEATTHDTKIYTLTPEGGGALPAAEAGAHIDLFLDQGLVRQYSLVRPSLRPAAYVVAVKRDRASRGGSLFVHERLREGDLIEISPPRNTFPLAPGEGPHLLIAGGIGLTPVWSMAQALEARNADWRLYASNRSRRDTPLLAELEASPRVHLHFDDEAGGFLDLPALIGDAPDRAHLYCCGPSPMLAAFRAAAASRPPDHVHFEAFTAEALGAEGDQAFTVRLAGSGRDIPIPAARSILETLRAEGLDLPSSCEVGVCGLCETKVLAGEVDHRDHVLSADEQARNDRMMICCSRARSPVLVLDL
jgi:ferredoxin-NADP reductase